MQFQPTLPARGATSNRSNDAAGGRHFNPRSPHGERQKVAVDQYQKALISTHAPRTGSDLGGVVLGQRLGAFQPTLPARGATRDAIDKL